MEIGFSSYSGADFLLFYGLLIVAAVFAGLWIPAFLRPDGKLAKVEDPELLAFLAGGQPRFAESVVAALFGRRDLRVEKKRIIKSVHAQGQIRAEQALLRVVGDISWNAAKSSLDGHAEAAERSLVHKGLLIPPNERLAFRLIPTLPYAFLLLLGIFRWQAGSAEGEPGGYLTMMMILVAVLGIIRMAKFNPRTRAGEDVLSRAQGDAQRLRSATTPGETGLAVSLFGTGILVGTPYAPLHAMRQQNSGAGADGGGSDGGGDGGCGGGGCGGCGG
ncbi:TIGR04222 domain-containing membrane protein [Aurantiacibacter zhengii]|uniref:TIGR04222 domain-containing membrane protein n=1 Tax=Aurantiacibacter zhengii TaxID=2307003 RepID=UPI0013147FA2|nr:TIGR04222 domain-containing membrane protein [Aurantiacibacter zhengii]